MSKLKNQKKASQTKYMEPEERAKIIDAVTEQEGLSDKETKRLVISTSTKVNFVKTAESLNVVPDTIQYRILRLFCEEKRATKVNAKVLIERIKGMSDEQLKILELICEKKDFTTTTILKSIPPIKKIGNERILTLRAFTDLDGVGAGNLNHFFMTTFPQGKRKDMGEDAYEREIREKMIRPDQANVFYNICYQIEGITPSTAIAALPKIRQLKQQHTQIINAFMTKEVSFGNKRIGDDNILGLINLWLSLPEMSDKKSVSSFIKRISKKPVEEKKDFQFIVTSFKTETEKPKSIDNIFSSVRGFFK